MAAANGLYFFTVTDAMALNSQSGDVLWASNGTGASLVKDIRPFGEALMSGVTGAGNLLYFAADDGINGRKLWKSDGTTAGTVIVNVNDGSSFPVGMTRIGTTLFYAALDGVNGSELWKSDGSPGGTVLVKDIRPGTASSSPAKLINVNGTLFFTANDGISGIELWKSDGLSAGTVLVKDIALGIGNSSPRALVAHSTGLYFIANDGTHGEQLWKSDGTAAGTMMVTVPGLPASFASVTNLFIFGDQLFFAASNAANGIELYAVSLPAKNTIPADFSFPARLEVVLNSLQVSNVVTITGIDSAVPVSIESTASEYSVGCTAVFTNVPGTISNGQTICVRHTSSTLPNGSTNSTLTIGGLSAAFTSITLGPKTLTVSKGGTGTGTVTSSPAGITCGGTCGADFASATVVTLTTNPDFGSAFAGWQGACIGTGACSITLDAAKSVTATFNTSNTTVPNAPTSPSAAPGNASAMVSFTAFSDSNAPITSFNVVDSMGTVVASGSSSPIPVTGLTNDVAYTFTITATNALGTSAPSSTVVVTPTASAPLTLVSVKSRKTHGAAGVFDMHVNASATLNGAISVEPRVGPTHYLVFQFNNVPASVTSASSTDAALTPVGSATPSIIGNEIVVALVGVLDNQRVRVSIIGVNGATTYQAPIGFLISDVSNSKSTNGSDVTSLKSHSGQVANSSNFLFDINLSGVVGAADVSGVKSRQGRVLP